MVTSRRVGRRRTPPGCQALICSKPRFLPPPSPLRLPCLFCRPRPSPVHRSRSAAHPPVGRPPVGRSSVRLRLHCRRTAARYRSLLRWRLPSRSQPRGVRRRRSAQRRPAIPRGAVACQPSWRWRRSAQPFPPRRAVMRCNGTSPVASRPSRPRRRRPLSRAPRSSPCLRTCRRHQRSVTGGQSRRRRMSKPCTAARHWGQNS